MKNNGSVRIKKSLCQRRRTSFVYRPICLKKMGVTTTKVADSLCSAAPMDQCSCKCFHEAQWTCEGESVVCKAKFGAGELKTVGDKVSSTPTIPSQGLRALFILQICRGTFSAVSNSIVTSLMLQYLEKIALLRTCTLLHCSRT